MAIDKALTQYSVPVVYPEYEVHMCTWMETYKIVMLETDRLTLKLRIQADALKPLRFACNVQFWRSAQPSSGVSGNLTQTATGARKSGTRFVMH